MSLSIQSLSLSQIHAAAELVFAAFMPSMDYHVMFPHGPSQTTIDHEVQRVAGELHDPDKWHLVVVDTPSSPNTATNQIETANNTSQLEQEEPHSSASSSITAESTNLLSYASYQLITPSDPSPPSPPSSPASNSSTSSIFYSDPPFPPDADPSALAYILTTLTSTRESAMRDSPTHLYLIQVATSPSARRRGAATMLVEWGLRKAAALDVPVFLVASAAGEALYARAGFRRVQQVRYDFWPWTDGTGRVPGFDGDALDLWAMRWDPPARAAEAA